MDKAEKFCKKFCTLFAQNVKNKKFSIDEFQDVDKAGEYYTHSKVIYLVNKTLEIFNYLFLNECYIRKSRKIKTPSPLIKVDIIAYHENDISKNYKIVVEYESIDSNDEKMNRYMDRISNIKDLEFSVLIGTFTTAKGRKRNNQIDKWGNSIYRDTKMYPKVKNHLKKIDPLYFKNGARLCLISIFNKQIEYIVSNGKLRGRSSNEYKLKWKD